MNDLSDSSRKREEISVISFVFGGLLMFGAIYRIYGLLDSGSSPE